MTPDFDGQGLCLSSLLINYQLRIFAVFFVCTYEKEVHIRGDTKASTTKFAFKLTTEVGLLIIKEFHFLSVWESIFHIDKFT